MQYNKELRKLSFKRKRYKIHKYRYVACIAVLLVLFSGFATSILNIYAAPSPWNQTDWSGGLGASTSNQYSIISNLVTSTVGEIGLNDSSKSNWMNHAWSYRKKITFDNTNSGIVGVAEVLTNFPVLIKLQNGVNIDYSKTKAAGADIRFADSNGTTSLNYEIELWNASGDSYVWVKVPQIDQNVNTDYIYIYYGNAAATDSQNKSGVWDSNYGGVWHLGETVANSNSGFLDSTSINNPGTALNFNSDGNSGTGDTGLIGKAPHFDGTDDQISMGDPANNSLDPLTSNMSLSFWFKRDVSDATTRYPVSKTSGGSAWYYTNVNSTTLTSGFRDSTLSGAPSLTNAAVGNTSWNYVVTTLDQTSDVMKLFLNGVTITSQATTAGLGSINSGNPFKISCRGTAGTGTECFDGYIDEVRFTKQALTPGWIAADYKSQSNTFATYASEEVFYNTGSITSNIFDTEQLSAWENLTFTTNGLGTYSVKVRSGLASNLSDATAFSSCTAVTSGTDLSLNSCIHDNDRYIQYQITVTLTSVVLPAFQNLSIDFTLAETTAPPTNATSIAISGVTTGQWINYEPTITWTAGADNIGGSGLIGYCVSLEEANVSTSTNLNPALSSGKLTGFDDGVVKTYCPYIVAGTTLNISSIASLTLIAGKQYYFSIKAVDDAGNIYIGASNTFQDLISFKYDDVSPTNPDYITLPASFISSKDVTMTWPTGVGAASDSASGIGGLQYRIGNGGIWYGDVHNGAQNATDFLTNDGSYTTNVTYDYPNLSEGSNNIYLRTWDAAGNISSSTLTGVLKINSTAPSSPQNLEVTPTSNTTNSYSFSWSTPATFTGLEGGITYCYTINTTPGLSSCNFTGTGVTSLNADAYATQPGINTFYVVAKDEAGNINYATQSFVEFSYTGSAPGIARNLDIGDLSIKTTSNWKLALGWDAPLDVGAGVSKYEVYRSTTNTTCTASFTSFTEVASLSGNSYVDSSLTQQTYYYCVKSCDSANTCSAVSSTVSAYPDGKYTDPAVLIDDVKITSVTTKKATFTWVTDRTSDSKVSYGIKTGEYFPEEIGSSVQAANHSITINSLKAGTTYYIQTKWTDEDGNTGTSTEKSFTTNQPPKVKEASAQSITVSSSLIRFTSVNAYKAKVYYGESDSLSKFEEINISPVETSYTVSIVDLKDNTKYFYRINLIDLEGEEYAGDIYSFSTLPRPRVSDISIQEVKNKAQPTVEVAWLSNTNISSIVSYYPQNNQDLKRDAIDLELKTEHKLKISSLSANTKYVLIVRGIDKIGNEATSTEYVFTTSTDSRPPEINNLKIETTLTNSDDDNNAQIIVSWETDEPATSQIEFGNGLNTSYSQTTSEDKNLKYDHLVVISSLSPSKVYSLRAIARDNTANESKSADTVTITPAKTESALELVVKNLVKVFGFL